MTFYGSRTDVVRFAKDLLVFFGTDLPLITITSRGSSGDCSAHIVIDTSLEDTVLQMALKYSLQRTDTSQATTPDG